MLSQAHSEEGRMRDSIPRTPFFSVFFTETWGIIEKGVEKKSADKFRLYRMRQPDVYTDSGERAIDK